MSIIFGSGSTMFSCSEWGPWSSRTGQPCSPMFTLYQPYRPYDWLHSRTSRSQLGRWGRRQRLNWMASMEKIAPSANWLKQFQAMRLASRPVLYRCNDKRVCHHQRKTRTELSLKSTGTLPNAKRQKEARGRKPKKSRSASRNTQQTFAIFLDCTVETPSQELASMKSLRDVWGWEGQPFTLLLDLRKRLSQGFSR